MLLSGAQLLIKPEVISEEKGYIYVVGASTKRLLIGAEAAGFVKESLDGTMRPFLYNNRMDFKNFDSKIWFSVLLLQQRFEFCFAMLDSALLPVILGLL